MASIEFITKRIEGKKAEIVKLEKKLARIEKAKASNWENNPYYYHEDDLKWTNRDLIIAHEALEKYEAEYLRAVEKANSRNVKAILDFLETWKQRVFDFYDKGMKPCFAEAAQVRELGSKVYSLHYGTDEYKAAETIHNAAYKAYYAKLNGYFKKEKYINRWGKEAEKSVKVEDGEWEYLRPYDSFHFKTYDEAVAKLKADLKREAEQKYDDIIERTNFIVGTITDARGLYVGNKGELNGIVIGDRGRARIETIGAGGYNIQCFHFRTLIHEIK